MPKYVKLSKTYGASRESSFNTKRFKLTILTFKLISATHPCPGSLSLSIHTKAVPQGHIPPIVNSLLDHLTKAVLPLGAPPQYPLNTLSSIYYYQLIAGIDHVP
jgi:hypothetical protein